MSEVNILEKLDRVLEELQVLKNEQTAMKKYYAEALSKTIIRQNDMDSIVEHINKLKELEAKNGKTKKQIRKQPKKRNCNAPSKSNS